MNLTAAPKNSEIGRRISEFREYLGMTQDELAAAVGGTKRGLQGNEAGIALPNSKLLLGLAGLGVNLNWLVTGHGKMLIESLAVPDDLAHQNAIDVINKAFEKSSASRALSLDEKELLLAFRAANPDRKQIFSDLARTTKIYKFA